MNKFAGVLCCLVLFGSVIHAGSAGAADDDTQASVYLVFDPETGEFITVNDAAVTAQHKAQQEQEAIDSVVDAADGTSVGNTGKSRLTWIIGAAVIVLLIGAAWVQRNRQHAA